MSKQDKGNVFEKEVIQLESSKKVVHDKTINKDELRSEFEKITKCYEQLLEETRLITSVSDRLQNKLNRANSKLTSQADEINEINSVLEKNNKELQHTIEELTKVRASRKAATIVLAFAIVLFIISEGFLEPIIESRVDNPYLGFISKGFIVLLLKPLEMVVERFLVRTQ